MKFSEVQKYRKQLSFNEKKELTTNELLHVMEKKGLILSNFYQELEMDNVAVSAHQDVNDTKDMVQLHSHTYYEILYCKSGNIQYLLGADRYRLRRGDIVFIPPGISHRPLYLDKLTEPYSRYVIWIAPDFVQKIQSSTPFKLLSDPVLLRTQDSGWEYLKEYFRTACWEAETKQEHFSLCLSSVAVQLLIHLSRACTHSKTLESLTEKRELLDELISYIEDHLAEKISLKSAAARFYISERTVSRLFQEKMDVSFYRYVTQRRLIAAKVLILNGEPLEQIGEKVGFSDYSSFFRAFKQAFSISPKQFRQDL